MGFEITDDQIDFNLYMTPPEELARIIEPMSLLTEVNEIASGRRDFGGLQLPWAKTKNQVRFHEGKIVVWTGITHHGKTQIVKQLMNYAIYGGHRVAFASLEELPADTIYDMACQALHSREPTPDWTEVYLSWVNDKLWVYDQQNMVSPERMIGVMNYCAKVKGVRHFVIDSLMRLDMDSDDYDRQRRFFNLLGAHAKANPVCVHIVCHARKQGGEERPLSIFDIRGSGDIINQADVIMNVWRNKRPRHERAKDDEPADALLITEKQRGRPRWIGLTKLWMDEGSGQFMAAADHQPMEFFGLGKQNYEQRAWWNET